MNLRRGIGGERAMIFGGARLASQNKKPAVAIKQTTNE
jgi:hypothetical protein